jgi:hypothetical protein
MSTPFGHVLIAKIILVLLMVGIAAINRFAIQPRTVAPIGESAIAVRALWRSVAWEQAVGGLVLAAVGLCVRRLLPSAFKVEEALEYLYDHGIPSSGELPVAVRGTKYRGARGRVIK